MHPPSTAAIAEAILGYLAQHPDAADTAEGIARWWLPADWAVDTERVNLALVRLIGEKRIGCQRNADNQEWYYGRSAGR